MAPKAFALRAMGLGSADGGWRFGLEGWAGLGHLKFLLGRALLSRSTPPCGWKGSGSERALPASDASLFLPWQLTLHSVC